MSVERLQKVLAKSGFGSRRACEKLIDGGFVKVNGKIAQLGQKVNANSDEILVWDQPIRKPDKKVYIAVNKPRGVVSSLVSQDDKPTVIDLIDCSERVYPVGRLDVDSEGLILLTNDGELTHQLSHPSFGHEKDYRVLINRKPAYSQIEKWRNGVVLDDGVKTLPVELKILQSTEEGTWMRIILIEGRKRIIRRTGQQLGLRVLRIQRTRIASLNLGNLNPGEWRDLSADEIKALKTSTQNQK